jgi:hypothetical protein
VTKAGVAELVDASDLKCVAVIEYVHFCPQTVALKLMGIDGTKRDLQNNSTFVFALECPDDLGLVLNVPGVMQRTIPKALAPPVG